MPDEVKDGFRKRKVRPKGWEAKAIKSGVIRDPKAPPDPPPATNPGDVVIGVPVATMKGEGA